ncbi:hypothetical protein KI387_031985, partial [Taxus chinensis]
MPQRNVISWNAMMAAYAKNGFVKKAVGLFDKIPQETWSYGTYPDHRESVQRRRHEKGVPICFLSAQPADFHQIASPSTASLLPSTDPWALAMFIGFCGFLPVVCLRQHPPRPLKNGKTLESCEDFYQRIKERNFDRC